MKRLRYALGLLLLTVFAQLGAVSHELGHFSKSHGVDARIEAVVQSDGSCADCPAFAQVVSPAFSHSFDSPGLARTSPERSSELRFAVADAAVPTPRSRGPPSAS